MVNSNYRVSQSITKTGMRLHRRCQHVIETGLVQLVENNEQITAVEARQLRCENLNAFNSFFNQSIQSGPKRYYALRYAYLELLEQLELWPKWLTN